MACTSSGWVCRWILPIDFGYVVLVLEGGLKIWEGQRVYRAQDRPRGVEIDIQYFIANFHN